MGFEFGEEANITDEWEWRFDLLVELLLLRVGPLLASSISEITGCGVLHSIESPQQEVQMLCNDARRCMLLLFLGCQQRAWRLCIV
jgi:hypothetical protein